MRTLIASPHEEHRTLLCNVLARLGHQVDAAVSQVEAFARVKADRYDIVFIAEPWAFQVSPERDLRPRATDPHLVPILSAATPSLAVEALKSGANDVLYPPEDTPEGHARIEEVLVRCERLRALSLRNQELQQKLSQAQSSNGIVALAGAMAHEMNQPLTVIVGLNELIIQDARKRGEPCAHAESMRKACSRLNALVKKLSAVTRSPNLAGQSAPSDLAETRIFAAGS
ncbi:MAG: histidine kinase dimerization/phospho-acceptor domain-containing protein [Anaerolineae bacterium]